MGPVHTGSGDFKPSGSGSGSGKKPGKAPANGMGPKRADLQRVLERVQKKDFYEIFRDPVTEEMVHPVGPGLQGV